MRVLWYSSFRKLGLKTLFRASKEKEIRKEGKETVFMKCPMNHDFLCTQGLMAKIGTSGHCTLGLWSIFPWKVTQNSFME